MQKLTSRFQNSYENESKYQVQPKQKRRKLEDSPDFKTY